MDYMFESPSMTDRSELTVTAANVKQALDRRKKTG